MGNFVRRRHEDVHEILVEDVVGEKIGVVKVSASIHLRESWAHLESDGALPKEPAGPHNRRIVRETTGHIVYGQGWGLNADEELPKPLSQIVASLKEHEGLEGIPYTDERFPAAFGEWAQSTHGVKATFREGKGSR